MKRLDLCSWNFNVPVTPGSQKSHLTPCKPQQKSYAPDAERENFSQPSCSPRLYSEHGPEQGFIGFDLLGGIAKTKIPLGLLHRPAVTEGDLGSLHTLFRCLPSKAPQCPMEASLKSRG